MAMLPTEDSLINPATTNAQQKNNFGSLRNFLADLLGTDSSNKRNARARLGVAPRAVRIDLASVDGIVDLTSAAPDTDDIHLVDNAEITSFIVDSGRVIRVRAGGTFTLKNGAAIITPKGVDIAAATGDSFMLRAIAADVVEVLCFTSVGSGVGPWSSIPIGSYVGIRDDIAGVPVPPTNDPAFRYIKLTAGDAYNTGVLTGETITGSAPLVSATAVVNLAGSPFHGKTERLLNTERRFLRPGTSGVIEAAGIETHTHTATQVAHAHSIQTYVQQGGGSYFFGDANTVLNNGSGPSLVNGGVSAAQPAITVNATGGTETRVKSMGITLYMRIK